MAGRTPLTITARAALVCFGAIAGVAGWSAPAHAAASTLSCPKALDKWKIVKAQGPDDVSGWRTLDCAYHAVSDHSASYLLVTWSVSGDSIPRHACGTKEAPSKVPSVGGGETLASNKRRAAVTIGWQLLDESPAIEAAARRHAATLLARAESEAQPCPSAKDAKPTTIAAPPADTASGTTDTSQSSGWDPIKALSFVGAIGAMGAGATALVRRRPRPARSDGAPAPGIVVDGPAAIAMLHGQGWISPVTRGDGSIGWKPTGDLEQYVSSDHGGWQPAFSTGTATPAGDAVHQLVGVAFTPGSDGLIDTITVVASSPPPAPPPAPIPDAALPSPAIPAATPPTRASLDPGSKMLLERSGEFLEFDGDAGALALPFALPAIVDTLAAVPPTASQPVAAVAASKPAPSPAPAPTASAPATTPSGPFARLLGPTGGTVAIGATDLHRVAPNWISADGAIAVGPFAGVHPTVKLGPGTIEVKVTPYRATAQLVERNGRIFVTEPSVKGPMADFLDTKDIRARVQAHIDQALNGPIAAHGLHVTGTTVAPDGIHITTGPVAP